MKENVESLEKEDAENKLISPCNCNGTSNVHDMLKKVEIYE